MFPVVLEINLASTFCQIYDEVEDHPETQTGDQDKNGVKGNHGIILSHSVEESMRNCALGLMTFWASILAIAALVAFFVRHVLSTGTADFFYLFRLHAPSSKPDKSIARSLF
jgi:hypothetical protein